MIELEYHKLYPNDLFLSEDSLFMISWGVGIRRHYLICG